MKVIKWISSEEAEGKDSPIGGLGGVKGGMLWTEYLELWPAEKYVYFEALRTSILERGAIKGQDHQYGPEGIPLFEDGTIASFSFRAWGDLLSAIYNTKIEERKWDYMDFYYIYLPEDERIK